MRLIDPYYPHVCNQVGKLCEQFGRSGDRVPAQDDKSKWSPKWPRSFRNGHSIPPREHGYRHVCNRGSSGSLRTSGRGSKAAIAGDWRRTGASLTSGSRRPSCCMDNLGPALMKIASAAFFIVAIFIAGIGSAVLIWFRSRLRPSVVRTVCTTVLFGGAVAALVALSLQMLSLS